MSHHVFWPCSCGMPMCPTCSAHDGMTTEDRLATVAARDADSRRAIAELRGILGVQPNESVVDAARRLVRTLAALRPEGVPK